MADNPTNTGSFPVLSEETSHRNGAALDDAAQTQGVFLVAVSSDGHVVDFDPRTIATDTALLAVRDRLGASTAPAAGTLAKLLTDILASVAGTLTTSPTTAGDVASTLTDGRKTIATAGVAAAIRGTIACEWVLVTALKTNTADVYVGGSGVIADAGSQTGVPLAAGESVTIPVNDAAKVFVDVLVNNEGVTFLVGA